MNKDLNEVMGENWKIISAVIVLLVIVIGALLFSYYYSGKVCTSYSCFQEKMSSCSKSSYINEVPEATWGYNILGKQDGLCAVRVKLLQAKQGMTDIRNLDGYYMDCSYPLGIATYPESDLSKCHGRLKEELQGLIIKKLYSYIVDNIGQVSESLKSAV